MQFFKKTPVISWFIKHINIEIKRDIETNFKFLKLAVSKGVMNSSQAGVKAEQGIAQLNFTCLMDSIELSRV